MINVLLAGYTHDPNGRVLCFEHSEFGYQDVWIDGRVLLHTGQRVSLMILDGHSYKTCRRHYIREDCR